MKYNTKIVIITGSNVQCAMEIELSSPEGSGGFEHKIAAKK